MSRPVWTLGIRGWICCLTADGITYHTPAIDPAIPRLDEWKWRWSHELQSAVIRDRSRFFKVSDTEFALPSMTG